MLVYGDVTRSVDAGALARKVADELELVAERMPGIERHETLRQAFIQAADLLNGLLDRDQTELDLQALMDVAIALGRSWETNFTHLTDLAAAARWFRALDPTGLIQVKPMEGYSFYAVYPESYWMAARRSGLQPGTQVIGIRSIGVGLAAMVAAGLGSGPPITVRPTGHPFNREVQVSAAWEQQALGGNPSAYAIVDEGPGLSGSSFGAVADWLETKGIPTENIHFFPSHLNDLGPKARDTHRERWSRATKHFVATDELLFGPNQRLRHWVEELTGPLDHPLEEITGGGWRRLVRGGEELPVQGWWERRKFLANRGDDNFLVKFAGLSADDTDKLGVAVQLEQAGVWAEPVGIVGGWLVERWSEAPNLTTVWLDRGTLLDGIAGYLKVRATILAAEPGADLATLREMAVYNASEAIGPAAATAIDRRLAGIERWQDAVKPILIDGRMQRWEWLVDEGRLIKTDALDHVRTHDFIGPQDSAWDVAGAIVEHQLDGAEAIRLAEDVGADPGLVDILLPCYLAFQLGAWTMANGEDDGEARRYRDALDRLLTSSQTL